MHAGAPAAELSSDDDSAIDALSREFEEAIANSTVWRGVVRTSVSLRAQNVRRQILAVHAQAARESVDVAGSLSQSESASPLHREVLRTLDQPLDLPGPRTELGRRFKQDLQAQLRTAPASVRERFRSAARSVAGSFTQRAATDEFSRLFINRVAGAAIDGVEIGDSALEAYARQIDDALGGRRFERMYRVTSMDFMTEVANGRSGREAAAHVAEAGRPFWTPSEVSTFTAHVRDAAVAPSLDTHPPALVPRSEPYADIRSAQNIVRGIDGRPNEVTEALATFDDWFPSQQGRDLRTARGEVIQAIEQAASSLPSGPSSPGRPARPTVRTPAVTRTASVASHSFARARSFSALRGFSRIGGVLIGNSATAAPGQTLDFRSFQWDRRADGIHFRLRGGDGREIRLGPYRPATIHTALAYAADGRPVTVTMVTASPLRELKILLHPALLDTPLGCRAIEIDRFVDIFTGSAPERRRQEADVHQQHAAYEVAWAHRLLKLEAVVRAQVSDQEESAFNSLFGRARAIVGNPDVNARTRAALRQADAFASADRSVLVAKPQFYEAGLVATMQSCARSSDPEQFGQCVANAAGDRIPSDVAWYAPPPQFTFWSGVRERTFEADANFSFMSRPGGTQAPQRLWPFDFMLQVAFTSPPAHLPEGVDPDGYQDDKPWEFPRLKQAIMTAVDLGLDAEQRAIVEDMGEFTILQRLFRLALNEQLGGQFPLGRLAALAKDTLPPAGSPYRTLRWNARPGLLERALAEELMMARRALAERVSANPLSQARQALAPIDACVVTAARPDARRLSDGQWKATCNLDRIAANVPASDPAAAVLTFARSRADETTRARQLRVHLGVTQEEHRVGGACPAVR